MPETNTNNDQNPEFDPREALEKLDALPEAEVSEIMAKVRDAINRILVEKKITPDQVPEVSAEFYNRSNRTGFVQLRETVNDKKSLQQVLDDIRDRKITEDISQLVHEAIRQVFQGKLRVEPKSESALPENPPAKPDSNISKDPVAERPNPSKPLPVDASTSDKKSASTASTETAVQAPKEGWMKKSWAYVKNFKRHPGTGDPVPVPKEGWMQKSWTSMKNFAAHPVKGIDNWFGFANKFFELPVIRWFNLFGDHYIGRFKDKSGGKGGGSSKAH